MQRLIFGKIIPEKDLLSRIMGPDMYGGYCYVTAVMHSPEDYPGKTVCLVHPLSHTETRIVRDEMGQPKVTF